MVLIQLLLPIGQDRAAVRWRGLAITIVFSADSDCFIMRYLRPLSFGMFAIRSSSCTTGNG